MATAAQRIADLEQQLTDLRDEIKALREKALVVGTLNELRLMRQMYMGDGSARAAPRRPRHLHALGGAE
jgi:hypothetical protein